MRELRSRSALPLVVIGEFSRHGKLSNFAVSIHIGVFSAAVRETKTVNQFTERGFWILLQDIQNANKIADDFCRC